MSHLYLVMPLKKEIIKTYQGFTIKYGLFGFEYSNGSLFGMITGFDLERVFEIVNRILKEKV